jgi:hypothetical protein
LEGSGQKEVRREISWPSMMKSKGVLEQKKKKKKRGRAKRS